MRVNDIDYEYFQSLVKINEEFESCLKSKFISTGYGGYIRTDEVALLDTFKSITDCKEYYASAINGYCQKNNMHFSDFVTKYGIKV